MTKPLYHKPELIAFTTRGNSIETLHHGWVCVLDKEKKIIYQKGNIFNHTFLRSIAKPIQAIPILDNNLDISTKELAIISGSHSGSKKHIDVLQKFAKKHKLHLTQLQCGTHPPLDETERNRLIKKNLSPNALHNNCSGKHLGMLAVCKTNKWDIKSYISPIHPLQKLILNKISDLSETKKIIIGIDGCSAPTFSMPIINIAKLFSNFTNKKNSNYEKIISAIEKNPFFMGGNNQIDTEIIKCSKGKLIAKVGAEGIIVAAYNGNSAIVKIADGSPKIRAAVLLHLLKKLKWLDSRSILRNPVLANILKGDIKNHSGKVVGKISVLLD